MIYTFYQSNNYAKFVEFLGFVLIEFGVCRLYISIVSNFTRREI